MGMSYSGKADTRVDKETKKVGGTPGKSKGYGSANVTTSRLNAGGDMKWRGKRGNKMAY